MSGCAERGCAGTVTDGFCDVCGLEPRGSQPVVPSVDAPRSDPLPTSGPDPGDVGSDGPPSGPEPPSAPPASADTDGHDTYARLVPLFSGPGDPIPPPRAETPDPPPRAAENPGDADEAAPSGPLPGSPGHSSIATPGPAPAPRDHTGPSAAAPAHQAHRSDPPRRLFFSDLSRHGGSSASGPLSSPSGRNSRRTSASSARGMLGLGLVQVPPVPYRDPATAIMANPVVAEKNRFCGSCGEAVGRRRDNRPGRTEGFCRTCGTEFSFTPKLKKGDLVDGQYEVLGCLAHGGLGWIYLARDHHVSDRWVVLKGLLNSGDAEAHKTATAERAFLAEVEHPNIVKIYNFVHHPDPKTGVPAGHIVMEYVGGKSLRDLIVERRAQGADSAGLPVDQVIAYGVEALRAIGYLHSKGLLYCDFKPDNIIQSEEQIKLIDLGGVRRIDDLVNPVYTTPGYRVPEAELRNPGPSVSSDLYSVGRTLAVLSFRFGFMREHLHSLPPGEEEPVLARYESYDRFLRRATHNQSDLRFHDAADMSEQLTGVLREVLSDIQGRPHPATSTLFEPEHFVAAAAGAADPDHVLSRPDPADAAAALPAPLVDPADAAAGILAGLSAVRPEEIVATLEAAKAPSPETRLMLARTLIALGRQEEAEEPLQAFCARAPGDWRTYWYLAVLDLSVGRYDEARARFEELYDHLPGEAAPKLGLALACEGSGDADAAARHFETVWRTDHSYVGAAFGLARIRLVQGRRDATVTVLDSVPELSTFFPNAQMAAVTVLVGDRDVGELDEQVLVDAGARLDRLRWNGLYGEATDRLAVRVLEAALAWVSSGRRPARSTWLLDAELDEEGLRWNLERMYRGLARRSTGRADRHRLVDKANSLRPRTWL
ncbi:serine/threonine-protein kinase PknG [Nocardiopsis mwathae]|uniref:non-specific serine/threonine protein kinase n=1 Tax=Nocardiopsis mwathae TaxID=1472723 RepID=A0A7W9YMB9_9ACTN|nr:serine/threonine-protein kinase [Nocardiopsis mwathae]MBB6174808.1 serine/threonine-protein kinase PknG [Nocardiopsis mwathae]